MAIDAEEAHGREDVAGGLVNHTGASFALDSLSSDYLPQHSGKLWQNPVVQPTQYYRIALRATQYKNGEIHCTLKSAVKMKIKVVVNCMLRQKEEVLWRTG